MLDAIGSLRGAGSVIAQPASLIVENDDVSAGQNASESSHYNQTYAPKLLRWEGFPANTTHVLSASSSKEPPELTGFEYSQVKIYVAAYNEFLRKGGRIHPKERFSQAQDLQYQTWYNQFEFYKDFGDWGDLASANPIQFLQIISDLAIVAYNIVDPFDASEIEVPLRNGKYDLISHLAHCRVVLLMNLRPIRPQSVLIEYYLNAIKKKLPRLAEYIIARYKGELLASGRSVQEATLEFVFATVAKVLVNVSQFEGLSLSGPDPQESLTTYIPRNQPSSFGNGQSNSRSFGNRTAPFAAVKPQPFQRKGNDSYSNHGRPFDKQEGTSTSTDFYQPSSKQQVATRSAMVAKDEPEKANKRSNEVVRDQTKRDISAPNAHT